MIRNFRTISFFALLLLFGCNSNDKLSSTELATNDSIAKYLRLAANDSLSFEERDRWNEKAFGLIDLTRNDTVVRWFLCQSALNFSRLKNGKKYTHISSLHFIKSLKASDTLNLARFYRYKGGYFRWNTKYDSAFYYYIKAEKLYKETNHDEEFAKLFYFKGMLQYEYDDYLGAELSTNQAYNLIKKRSPDEFTYHVLTQLGNINHNLGYFKNAIMFNEEALKLCRDLNLTARKKKLNYISSSFNNIGNSYKELKEYDKAILYFEKGFRENDDIQDQSTNAYLLNNFGFCKMQQKKYKELPDLFFRSAKIFDSLKIYNESSLSNVYLSDYYYRVKDTLNANFYAEKALRIAKESKASYYYLIALSNAGFVDKAKGSKYIKEYHEKNDSIRSEERKARNQFYKIQLQTEEIAQEKEIAIRQKWITTSIITVLLLIVILLFVIYLQRAKQKEMLLLQTQQKANGEIYQLMLNQQTKVEEARQKEKKRIALELHDRIMNRLASTRLNLFVLSKKTDQETIKNCLNYIEDIHQIENEIRNVSHDLNQDLFQEKDNFVTLLTEFIREQNSISKSKYELQIENTINWESISNEIKMHIFRIIQEASYNCNKYANATNVVICFTIDERNICVSISDNGNGFDTEKEIDGIGLKNMQERIKTLNGFFSIKSSSDGTTLYLMIPFKK